MTSDAPDRTEEPQETSPSGRASSSQGRPEEKTAAPGREETSRSRRVWPVVGVLAAAAVILVGAVGYLLSGDDGPGRGGQQPPSVAVAEAASDSWTQRVTAAGGLRAVRKIDVAATVPGKIVEIAFKSGDRVDAGNTLVKQESAEEAAALAATEARLAQARLDAERARKLYRRGAGAESNADASAAEAEALAADADRQRAAIDKKTIGAPFAGRLGIRQADLGAYLAPGQAIVSLQQIAPIHARFSLPERHFARIALGQTVTVAVDAYPDETFEGEITEIEPAIDEATRTFVVQATLPNDDRRLAPGMFADVAATFSEAREVVTIPATAVAYNAYGASVFLVRDGAAYRAEQADRAEASKAASRASSETGAGWLAQSKAALGGLFGSSEAGRSREADSAPEHVAQRRFVSTGERRGLDIEIVEGLKAGDRIVTAGQLKLSDGRPVRIVESGVLEDAQPKPSKP